MSCTHGDSSVSQSTSVGNKDLLSSAFFESSPLYTSDFLSLERIFYLIYMQNKAHHSVFFSAGQANVTQGHDLRQADALGRFVGTQCRRTSEWLKDFILQRWCCWTTPVCYLAWPVTVWRIYENSYCGNDMRARVRAAVLLSFWLLKEFVLAAQRALVRAD